MAYNKYHAIKEVYKGIKFDSQTECDYFKHLEGLGYVHGKTFFTQVEYVLMESFKLNGKTVRGVKYYADFVIIEDDGTKKVVDIKGFLIGAVFNLKMKMMKKRYGIEVITIVRCPKYYLAENNKEEWLLMSIKKKIRKCPKRLLDKNDNKPWILNTKLTKLNK